MSEYSWNGRDVEFIEFDIAAGEEVMAATVDQAQRSRAYFLTLVHSARYVDDKSPVFSSVDEIRALPFRLIQRVQRLAAAAAVKNEIEVVDDDAAPLPEPRADIPSSARALNGSAGQ